MKLENWLKQGFNMSQTSMVANSSENVSSQDRIDKLKSVEISIYLSVFCGFSTRREVLARVKKA